MIGSLTCPSNPRLIVVGILLSGLMPNLANAGMPSPLPDDLSEVMKWMDDPEPPKMRLRNEPGKRLQVISFFVLVLLFSALVVKWFEE